MGYWKKENVLVSFSGGRTSAFMAKWLKDNCSDFFNLVFVYANTGLERQETLNFVARCDYEFGLDVKYLEAKINPEYRKGTTYELKDNTSLKTCGDYMTPFEQMIIKYGLPNQKFPHCTRELKTVPIYKFGQDYFGTNDFYQAIGIRIDEIDRMSANRKERKLIYPLISAIPTTEKDVDNFWKKQKFNLELEGYEGNCSLCWKKDLRKLALIAKERPYDLNAFYSLEAKYKYHYPNKEPFMDEFGVKEKPIYMFRGHTSLLEIEKMEVSKPEILKIKKQRQESCDAHAECGIDN